MNIQPNANEKAGSPVEKLYDLCMIEMLCHGNKEQVNKMVRVFIDQVPKSVEEIKTAYSKRDYEVIKKVAHRIKPVLRYYAIIKVEKDMLLIEQWAKEETATKELELKIRNLDTVIIKVVEQLKKNFLY